MIRTEDPGDYVMGAEEVHALRVFHSMLRAASTCDHGSSGSGNVHDDEISRGLIRRLPGSTG